MPAFAEEGRQFTVLALVTAAALLALLAVQLGARDASSTSAARPLWEVVQRWLSPRGAVWAPAHAKAVRDSSAPCAGMRHFHCI